MSSKKSENRFRTSNKQAVPASNAAVSEFFQHLKSCSTAELDIGYDLDIKKQAVPAPNAAVSEFFQYLKSCSMAELDIGYDLDIKKQAVPAPNAIATA